MAEMTDYPISPERRRIEHLAKEYSRPYKTLHKRHPMDGGFYEIHYGIERLQRADEVLVFLRQTGRDPDETLRDIDALLSDIRSGLVSTREILTESGFLELIDDHFDTLMQGVSGETLPPDEAETLDAMGFPHLAAIVREHFDVVGHEWRSETAVGVPVAREYRSKPGSGSLGAAIDGVERYQQERRQAAELQGSTESTQGRGNDQSPKRSRRWWKGIGQVIQGASIAVVDVGMAVGAFKFPVSPETQTYGAIVSICGGFGTMMNGVGDLWGE